MKIAQKLGLLVGALLAAVLVTILVLSAQLSSTSKEYKELIGGNIQQREASRTMLVAFGQQVTAFQQILLQARGKADYERLRKEYDARTGTVATLTDELLANVGPEDPRLKTSLEEFKSSHAAVGFQYSAALDAFVNSRYKDAEGISTSVEGLEKFPNDLVNNIADYRTRSADEMIQQQNDSTASRLRLIYIGGVLLLLMATGFAVVVVRGIVRPVRSLTSAALEVANQRLPKVVAEIADLPAEAPAPSLPRFRVDTKDELSELAGALSTLQDSAVDLALEQRRNEQANADTLVNLGRRNQSLMTRMLGYVTELERDESNPGALDKLFRLDHLTTRIRRNAESLLVLAGAKQTRTWSHPIAMQDVVRASLSEIEEYNRVTVHHMDHAKVSGSVAADLTHMLAELLENGTRFSPRERQVQVVGRLIPSGYQFDVIDSGLGMTDEELSSANERIAQAGSRRPDAKVLGLHVVGRIAARRDMVVQLLPSDQVGLTAQVLVPASVISDAKLPTNFHEVTDVPMLSAAPAPRPDGAPAPLEPAMAPTPRRTPNAAPAGRPTPKPAGNGVVQPFPAGSTMGGAGGSYAPPADNPLSQLPQLTSGVSSNLSLPGGAPNGGHGSNGHGSNGNDGNPSRRVRGAQLGDLGTNLRDQAPRPVNAEAARSQMSSLQSGVAAARQNGPGANGYGQNPGQSQQQSQSQYQNPGQHPGYSQNQGYSQAPGNSLASTRGGNLPSPATAQTPVTPPGPAPVRRVRGAQLGELGAGAPGESQNTTVDPNRVRSQMSSLQSGVAAARREAGPTGDPSQNPPPTEPVRRVRGAQLSELDTGNGGAFRGLPRDAAGIGRQLSGLQQATTRAERETGRHHAGDEDTKGNN
ncbi:HAMP domain-containing sensor histidine kinase [Kineosporia succinea]|uniref:histidine kinase n=1 Tax=Kineosporia succinea TaxID=84632 RepID=A0ABT9P2S1_9ACTN|nr:ATP-binding protein [Kineosporia succinea]MDP9826977.1 HAMP domain-containing protein [Kineosporia succinea]